MPPVGLCKGGAGWQGPDPGVRGQLELPQGAVNPALCVGFSTAGGG